MPQKFDFLHPEVTFLLGKQLVFSQGLEEYPQVGSMILSSLKVNQDVINEHYNKIIQVWSENSVHKIHEGCWSIR